MKHSINFLYLWFPSWLKMRVTLAVLNLFLALTTGKSLCDNPAEKTTTLYLANNQVLQNHVIQNVRKSSPVICGRECSMTPQCASFNYYASENLCELSNATRIQHLCDFVQQQGGSYFDKSLTTLFLSSLYTKKNTSCQMLLSAGYQDNGIYTIYPAGLTKGLQVYCDMETEKGGWIVFQRRQDGSVDFYRNWDEYKCGFGDLYGEFWLGNEALRILTETGQWQLRVDMWDWEGNTAWAGYGEFAISGEKYTLHVGSYDADSTAGTGDSMARHNAQHFTTRDQDNDALQNGNCAQNTEGAWWFEKCFHAHLNAKYYHHSNIPYSRGIQWYHWKNSHEYSLKQCNMKMRQFI